MGWYIYKKLIYSWCITQRQIIRRSEKVDGSREDKTINGLELFMRLKNRYMPGPHFTKYNERCIWF